jgi:large subunit ribosomal protein L25
MKQFSLKVSSRAGIGRGASRRVRQGGGIPAVIYGTINPPQTLALDTPEFTRLLKGIAGSAAVIEIKENEADQRLSIIKEIQRDAMTDRILHVDLQEVSANEEMELNVSVHAIGDCYGVRVENGILEFVSHEVRIRCLPKNLPAFIEVDITDLKVEHAIHVSQLPKIEGVAYMGDPQRPVIACVKPIVEVEATPAAGTEAAAAAAAAPAAAGAAAAPAAAAGAAAPAAGAKAPAGKAPAGKAPEKK